jgi:hypothetical protein
MHEKTAIGAVALVLSFAAAACGGASGQTSGGDGQSTAPSPAPTSTSGGSQTGTPASTPAANAPSAPPAPLGSPVTAPLRQWTWVDVPGSTCADGSQTGFGVNLTDTSDDVLIFMEGGGACWDGQSCWGPVQTAFYVATGYGKAEFQADPQIGAIYTLNRDDTDNAFKDKNIVYIPYCTGDSYAGDNVASLDYLGTTHDTHFKGYANVGLFLQRIVPTFPKAKHVWLSGDSAGGFGSSFNFARTQDAFKTARVDVLDDSGQPIAPDPARWALWRSAWNMQVPADCPACQVSPAGFVDYYRTKYPASRFGLVSFDYDSVIPTFMNLTSFQFHDELYLMLGKMDGEWLNGRYFILPGSSHVGLATPTSALKEWVTKMVTDDAGWTSVRP